MYVPQNSMWWEILKNFWFSGWNKQGHMHACCLPAHSWILTNTRQCTNGYREAGSSLDTYGVLQCCVQHHHVFWKCIVASQADRDVRGSASSQPRLPCKCACGCWGPATRPMHVYSLRTWIIYRFNLLALSLKRELANQTMQHCCKSNNYGVI